MGPFMDESSNLKGIEEGIVLEGPCDMVVEQWLFFDFQASKN